MVRAVAHRVQESFDVRADINDSEGWSILELNPGPDQLMVIVNFDCSYQLESRRRIFMQDEELDSDDFEVNVEFLTNSAIIFGKTGTVFETPRRRSLRGPRSWQPWPGKGGSAL